MGNDWTTSIAGWLASTSRRSACVIAFPEYRPDLVLSLARAAKARLVDFRLTKMAPLGWQATQLPLSAIDELALAEMASGNDVVVQNVEALLSSVSTDKRRAWLNDALGKSWPNRLILPFTLYAHEVEAPHKGAVFTLSIQDLPEDTLLQRLSGLRS